jgi:predicted nucleic acid-binding protein
MHLELTPRTPDAMADTVRKSHELGLTAHDSAYLSLATTEGGYLVTSDKGF